MKKGITIHDISQALGISSATVSRALNDHPRISKKTREKVKAYALKSGYSPNTLASSLRKGESKTVGIVVPRINRHFFSNVIGGMEKILNAAGYSLIICQSYEDYEKELYNLNTLINLHVDAIFISLATGTRDTSHIKTIINRGIRTIMFDRIDDSLKTDSVRLNDYKAADQIVQHMIDKGCKKIFHFSGPKHISIYRERMDAYTDALENNKLETNDFMIMDDILTKEKGYDAMMQLIESKNIPDGIFSASDYSALGAMLACREKNIKIPENIALAGFANEPFTGIIDPALTSADQNPKIMGREMAKLFLNKKKNQAPERIVLDPEIIIRKST